MGMLLLLLVFSLVNEAYCERRMPYLYTSISCVSILKNIANCL